LLFHTIKMPQYFHCLLLCPLLYFFYPILSISQLMDPDKAKLFARGGRKAADLTKPRWPSCRRMILWYARPCYYIILKLTIRCNSANEQACTDVRQMSKSIHLPYSSNNLE
jgi:hypothetical protein